MLAEIASGGMATVYAARVTGAQGFEKLVAVKRMLPAISSDPECRNMFIDEGRLAAHIRSSYVVSTFDLQEHEDGSLYLVMDLVIGASLASVLRGSAGAPLPIPVVAHVLQHAARGLHDAHEACSPLGQPLRIVHRDISPQNILVGLDGATRITDFGIAHAEERLAKTGARELKGKMAYFSPEQAKSEHVDGRSDLFSLGIVLWETLTQRRLFRCADVAATLSAVLNGPIQDPRDIRPEISPELAAVVMRALERAPERRYQTGLQFAEALVGAVSPASVADTQAIVRQYAGDSVGQLVAAIQGAVENNEALQNHATERDMPAVAQNMLPTVAMQQVDIGLLQSTGPMPIFEGTESGFAPHVTPPIERASPLGAPKAHEDATEWHGAPSPHVADPRKEARNKSIITALLGVLVAIVVGALVAVGAQDAESERMAALEPPMGFTVDENEPAPQLPALGTQAPQDLGAAGAATVIDPLGNEPPFEELEVEAEPLDLERQDSSERTNPGVHLQGVSCRPNGGEGFSSAEVARIEERIRNVRCAPEGHFFLLAYYRGRFSNIVYRDQNAHTICFHEGVSAAARMVRPVEGSLVCRTSD